MGAKSSRSRLCIPWGLNEECEEDSVKTSGDVHLLTFAPVPEPWPHSRFRVCNTLTLCPRNQGKVILMEDTSARRSVVAKQMPVKWTAMDVKTFLARRPGEIEIPWMDIALTSWLNDHSFPNCVDFIGVFHENQNVLSFVMGHADGGDLYSFMQENEIPEPGPQREKFWIPIVAELLQAVSWLHEKGIAHNDLSLENVLISNKGPKVRIVDFSMATTSRLRSGTPGKPSYTAPEVWSGKSDPFRLDAFACGVILYALSVSDYPWLSTRPGGCKLFEHTKQNGLRAHIHKRRLRGSQGTTVRDVVSEPLFLLFQALLNFNPEARAAITGTADDKNSVWSHSWLQQLTLKDTEPHVVPCSDPTHPAANAEKKVGAEEPAHETSVPQGSLGLSGGMNPIGTLDSDQGPFEWDDRLSEELQQSVDSIFRDNMWKLKFSCTIADPMQPDCPIVAMSSGFADLTGYQVSEVIGRNCRFLLDAVPPSYVNSSMRKKVRMFCKVSDDGAIAPSKDSKPEIADKITMTALPKDEAFCVQTNARRTGELFQNMFHLKHVNLNDAPFIIGLQAEYSGDVGMQDAFHSLSDNMTKIEQLLASMVWYSASIRRQRRAPHEDGMESNEDTVGGSVVII